MPWMLISELFPLKLRLIASGVAIAFDYSLAFLSKKTYHNLETTLSLAGTTTFFCTVSFIGLIFAYFVLPETEGRSLEDIELHFTDDSKKFTDWRIAKTTNFKTEQSKK